MKDKVALVSGAAAGIGLATVKELIANKAKVIATDMVDVPGMEHSNIMDVSSEEQWNAVVEYAKKEFGGIDILVNCAGIMRKGLAEETSSAMWDEVLNVNLKGVFLGCKTVIPVMRERGGGAIVNVASIDAIRGNRRHVAYAASKGGIIAMTMAMALDHAKDNIRINSVCPGSVDTAMFRSALSSAQNPEEFMRWVIDKHPIGRLAKPEEIATAIAFLCSSKASFMTGLAIPVDGARSIR